MIRKGNKNPRKYLAIALRTDYWRPGTDYVDEILKRISATVIDGDFVIVSEKAIAVANNQLINEKNIVPGFAARFIAKYWMRIVWGYILSRSCHMTRKTKMRLRKYPLNEGSAHKQICLRYTSLHQTLRHGSEGGIDASNLPFSYVCLPLKKPQEEAEELQRLISHKIGCNISVIIADTDKTYTFGRKNYSPVEKALPGIRTHGGIFTYVLCRTLRCKRRATPLGYSGESQNLDIILDISEIANRARGVGAGRSPWHMVSRFRVRFDEVTWEMLDSVNHYPVVIVRPLN
jgi:F420-0:gamma-glutamyl ligase-like protein